MVRHQVVVLCLVLILLMPACSTAKEKDISRGVQKPVVAGMFYPADPSELKAAVRSYLKGARAKELKGHLMGLVAPHAGYRFSGPVAGYAFKQLEGKRYTTVVVMAPSHRVPVGGAALSAKDLYETPLGKVPIDTDAVKKLVTKYPWLDDDQRPFEVEHSLEVELPFLQETLSGFKLVPLIVGAHSKSTLDSIAEALNRELPGDDVLFVASTDLSHYMPYDRAIAQDKKTLSYIKRGDTDAFWDAVTSGDVQACGAGPLYIVMRLWKMRGGGDVEVLQYLNSGDTAGDKSKVVGYAAVAFTTGGGKKETSNPTKAGFTLNEKQKETLLKLARGTVVAHVNGKKLPSIKTDDPLFKRNGASFVTLKKNGELRGCIGHIIAREPLIENVRNMAVAAVSSDPRFSPVRPSELKDIHVEVSVLTPPQPLPNPMEVDVGTDGLIIQRGFNRGVLLPQVPTELGWNKDQYLKGICQKAGMEPTCWKTATLEKFQAIVFGE